MVLILRPPPTRSKFQGLGAYLSNVLLYSQCFVQCVLYSVCAQQIVVEWKYIDTLPVTSYWIQKLILWGRWGDGHFIYEETEERMPINCPCFYTKYNKESFISMQACLTLNPGFYFLVFVSPCGMRMVPFHQSWKFKIKI